jgi:exodeoxyribonuclease VII small subunit
MDKNIEELTFEESLKELEKLVDMLENGKLDLDKSLDIYENAVRLRDHCKKILEKSERRVQKLMETADGVKKEELN